MAPAPTTNDSVERQRRRPPRWVLVTAWAAVLAEMVVAVACLAGGLFRDSDADPGPGGSPPGRDLASILAGDGRQSAGDRREHTTAVRGLLAARAAAVLRRDEAAFLATVDPAAGSLRARQAAQFDNLAAVPVTSWSYRLDPSRETPLPPAVATVYGVDAWAPTVELRFALAGFDEVPTVQEQRFVFARSADRWYLADDGAGGQPAPVGSGAVRNLWDFGPVRVLRTRSLRVLGRPGTERLMRWVLSAGEVATARVAATLPGWNRRTVVVVPADAAELAAVVERHGDLSAVAAFASADRSRDGPPTGKRVVVNPAVFGTLSPVGRQIVLSHEMTHVAVREVTTPATPQWLAEGFADYVAYRGTGTSARTAAHELADELARGEVPDQLPGDADFGSASPRLAQAYQQAWLACRLIADRVGPAGLVRLYRQAGAPGADFETVFRAEVGMSTVDFVTAWRSFLQEQLT